MHSGKEKEGEEGWKSISSEVERERMGPSFFLSSPPPFFEGA